MPYKIRRSSERKHFDHGWLNTYHTFSFGNYYDPQFMGFRDLRVINEDKVAPNKGFPPHTHANMEIISIILEGELAHQDSTGTQSTIKPNVVQVMSAGTGITHSEFNPSENIPVHFLQIWITPDTKEIPPRYAQVELPPIASNQWVLIASKNEKLKIQQDVNLYALTLDKGKKEKKAISQNRYGWIQVIDGELSMNNDTLYTGDGVALDPNTTIEIEAKTPSRILFFDLK